MEAAWQLKRRIETQVEDTLEEGTVNANLQGSIMYLEFREVSEDLIQLSEIFNLLNQAKIDSTDYKYGFRKVVGRPEDIYLRFRFKNYDQKEFDEFSVLAIITPEAGVKELSDGYIVIKHSEVFRYFIRVSEHQELWKKLKALAYMNMVTYLKKNLRSKAASFPTYAKSIKR